MKRMNWELIRSNVEEAEEELQGLLKKLRGKGRMSETGLQVSLKHAFHHLNFAWNARRAPMRRYVHLNQRDFDRWGQFPKNLWLAFHKSKL